MKATNVQSKRKKYIKISDMKERKKDVKRNETKQNDTKRKQYKKENKEIK